MCSTALRTIRQWRPSPARTGLDLQLELPGRAGALDWRQSKRSCGAVSQFELKIQTSSDEESSRSLLVGQIGAKMSRTLRAQCRRKRGGSKSTPAPARQSGERRGLTLGVQCPTYRNNNGRAGLGPPSIGRPDCSIRTFRLWRPNSARTDLDLKLKLPNHAVALDW